MIFAYFILAVALLIEAVGAYYSITGLAAIFSGAVVPILIMGGSLEVGKVTAAVWLKNNWSRASIAYKLYLLPAVILLMVITSMGIFGFLSKAHNDQNLVSGDVQSKIAIYDMKIETAKGNIDANRKALKQMDESVDQTMGRSNDEKGADKAVALRKSQTKERARLLAEITAEQKTIAQLNDEAAPIRAEVRKVEAEVGPIKYIAKFIYGENGADENMLEKAVTWVIILIVAVFDPLALVLILAAQQSLRWVREDQEERKDVEEFMEAAAEELAKDLDLQETKLADIVEPVPEVTVVEPEPSLLEKHPYLLKPFSHFGNLTPMVSTTYTVNDDTAAMNIVPPEELDTEVRPFTEEEIAALDEATLEVAVPEQSVETQEEHTPVEVNKDTQAGELAGELETPQILTFGIDDVERPGDYVTPPVYEEPEVEKPKVTPVPEVGIARNRGVMSSHIVQADNVPQLGTPSRSDFGNEFPVNPSKGDSYLRTDYLPNRLFKFNGVKWIEVDKNQADSYVYNDMYIKHLVDEIAAARYDVENLTDSERAQIDEYLNRKI